MKKGQGGFTFIQEGASGGGGLRGAFSNFMLGM